MDDVHRLTEAVLGAVRVVKGGGDLRGDPDAYVDRDSVAILSGPPDHLPEWYAIDPLHRDEVATLEIAELVDVADVRMIELDGQARLVEEHLHELVVVGDVGQDALDHHVARPRPRRLPRQEDLRHPSERQAPEDLVASEHADGRERRGAAGGRPHGGRRGAWHLEPVEVDLDHVVRVEGLDRWWELGEGLFPRTQGRSCR